jgi:DNA primase
MQEVEHLDFKEAKEKLYKITNTPLEDYTITLKKEEPKQKEDAKELEAINNFVMTEYSKMQYKDELIKYLNDRNISQDAIEKYHLFMSKDEKGIKRVYIPIIEQGKAKAYIGRAIDKNIPSNMRYRNNKGTIPPFNLNYIKEKAKENEAIYICEGVFDAISIEEQGKKAISINSVNNKEKLINAIKENIDTAKDYIYIIASDTDDKRTEI